MSAMKFQDQYQAKQFFIDKVMAQAERSNIHLSEAERYMLGWTETEDGFTVEQDMVEKFNAETTDKYFETKIKGLLLNVYDHDKRTNPDIRETYFNAYNALKNHDHYIMVMIKEALGPSLKLSGAGLFSGGFSALIRRIDPGTLDMIFLLITALLVAILAFSYFAILENDSWLNKEWKVFILGCITYTFTFNYLIRKYKIRPDVLSYFTKKDSRFPLVLRLAFNTLPVILIGALIYFGKLYFPDSSYWPSDRRTIVMSSVFAGPSLGFVADYYYKDVLERIVLKKIERSEI